MTEAHRRIRAAVITGIGQLLGLTGSILIGVLVAGKLPPSSRVDAFFAANQVYALSLYVGQAVRITAPALLVRAGVEPRKLKVAVSWLMLVTVLVLGAAAVAGRAAVPAPARSDFTRDLLLLLPAAALHVGAGAVAARMAVYGSFAWASAAYAAGSVVSGFLLLVVIGDDGASAIAPCLLAGAVAMSLVMVVGHLRVMPGRAGDEQRGLVGVAPAATLVSAAEGVDARPQHVAVGDPALDSLAGHGTATFAAQRIAFGAVPALAMQALIAAVTLAAGHVVAGGTALLSYSFLALFAFTTVAITPMSIVLGPELAERWDGHAGSLQSIIGRATRLSMVVAVPLVAVGFLVGRPLAGELLAALTPGDLDLVFQMLAILCPSLLLTAAATAATVGITAADRLATLAKVLAVIIAILVPVTVLMAVAQFPLLAIAAVASAFAIAFSVATLFVAIGKAAWPSAVEMIRENVPVVLPTLVLVALFAPVVRDNLALGVLAAAWAIVLHGGLMWLARRDALELLVGALRARRSVA
ncbi:MAG: hypothetical protein J7513_00360 [Solirubrobacteraceae bacterium]|nr:hypothetical protein [Solirubrobacteraceae bacterium]